MDFESLLSRLQDVEKGTEEVQGETVALLTDIYREKCWSPATSPSGRDSSEIRKHCFASEAKGDSVAPEHEGDYVASEVEDDSVAPEHDGDYVASEVEDDSVASETKGEYVASEAKEDSVASEANEDSVATGTGSCQHWRDAMEWSDDRVKRYRSLLEVTQDKLDRVQEKLCESRFREYQLANLRKLGHLVWKDEMAAMTARAEAAERRAEEEAARAEAAEQKVKEEERKREGLVARVEAAERRAEAAERGAEELAAWADAEKERREEVEANLKAVQVELDVARETTSKGREAFARAEAAEKAVESSTKCNPKENQEKQIGRTEEARERDFEHKPKVREASARLSTGEARARARAPAGATREREQEATPRGTVSRRASVPTRNRSPRDLAVSPLRPRWR